MQLKTASATAHIPVVGDFVIKLKDVKLTTLDIDSSSTGVSLGEDGTFVLLVNKLAAAVEGHFQWRRTKFPYISGGCQVKVTAEVRLRNDVSPGHAIVFRSGVQSLHSCCQSFHDLCLRENAR